MTQAPAKASRPQLVCRVCSSSNTHLMVEVESNQVLRCEACDHVFLNVAHTAESISTLYEDYGQQGENQYFSAAHGPNVWEYYFEQVGAQPPRNTPRRCELPI